MPEQRKEQLDDNARKFIVTAIDPCLLEAKDVTSFTLVTDWLEADIEYEKKLAYKQFSDSNVQILLIEKTTKDGKRVSKKQVISEEKYRELLADSIIHLEKIRHDFSYLQNDTSFAMKYDEFVDSDLRVLEVDAVSEAERESFDPSDFPAQTREVTGNVKFYGFRIASEV